MELNAPTRISVDGWLLSGRRVSSPYCNERPPNTQISLLVIHNISLPPGCYGGGYIERFFCGGLDPNEHPYFREIAQLEVSAHVLIDRRGNITQFVSFQQRAWHAGVSSFEGCENCNDFSVGIELEGTDDSAYTSAQYQALAGLTRDLIAAYPALTSDRIVGHCDIAPGRKTDPGPAFDWQTYLDQL